MRTRIRTETRSSTLFVALPVLLAAALPREARAEPCVPSAGAPCDWEERVSAQPDLKTILQAIEARNPDLREAQARALAADARAGAAGGLPDLELKGELWGVPLSHPVSFSMADTIMVGLRQAFPAWGSLDARERAARADAQAVEDGARSRRQEIAAQARRAFATYYRTDHEIRLHLEHAGLTSRLLETTRAQYELGRGTQQDNLRLQAELSRLHAEVTTVEQQRASARALLNTLMNRPADARLGPSPEIPVADLLAAKDDGRPAESERALDERRPELLAAARAVSRTEATLDASKREATYPTVMVGADYWYMPTLPMSHGYGAMLTVSLPWLNRRHADEVRSAERTLVAERSALEAQRASARFQLHDAAAKVRAARAALEILHGRVLPDARRAYEAAEAQVQAGHGNVPALIESARAYLGARIDEVRAVAELEASRADYARAAGEAQ